MTARGKSITFSAMNDESEDLKSNEPGAHKRTRNSRSYPTHTLEDALTVASAIQRSNAGLPFDRVLLAEALGTTKGSSGYTMRLNSSKRYGLTLGGYKDELISLTPRGRAVVAPRDAEEKRKALLDAALEPHVFGSFYRMVQGEILPEDTYAHNMLRRELGVHHDLAEECFTIIKSNGTHVGVLKEIDGALRVDTMDSPPASRTDPEDDQPEVAAPDIAAAREELRRPAAHTGRVLIVHRKASEAARLVKDLLARFQIPYNSLDRGANDSPALAQGLPDEMRECTSAILVLADSESRQFHRGNKAPDPMLFYLGVTWQRYGARVVIFKEAQLELGADFSDLPTVVFDPDNPEKAGLELLHQLHLAGAIGVMASA